MLLRSLLLVFLLGATIATAHDFLGPQSCQGCHPEAYAAWKASPHARARDSLSPLQQQNVRCLSCHSPNESDQKVSQITCETCHGGGQHYASRFVMKDGELARLVGLVDPGERACRSCHDASTPSVRVFDFAAKLKAIDHGSTDRRTAASRPTSGGALP